jgi:hypothetical protein
MGKVKVHAIILHVKRKVVSVSGLDEVVRQDRIGDAVPSTLQRCRVLVKSLRCEIHKGDTPLPSNLPRSGLVSRSEFFCNWKNVSDTGSDNAESLPPTSNPDTLAMVQTYGVARAHHEPTNHVPDHGGEASALLGSDATVKQGGKLEGHASLISCVSNLSNTIIGTGP